MPKRPPRHHRHHDTRRRGQRGHNEAGFVADAASRVLVYLDAWDSGHIDRFARPQHTFGEASDFTVGHTREVDRHQEGGHLVVGNLAVRVADDEKLDLFRGQFFAVPFPLNQVNCAHYETLRLTLPKGECKGSESGQMSETVTSGPSQSITYHG